GDHGGVVQRSGDVVGRGGERGGRGGRADRDERIGCLGLADPGQDLGAGQVARVRGGFVGGGADDDRGGDPDSQADRGQRRPGAGLVTGQVAQRQPDGDRGAAAGRGQGPGGQRADGQEPQGHRQRAGDDQRGAGLVGQGQAAGARHDQQPGQQGRAVGGLGPRRPGRQGEGDRQPGGHPGWPPRGGGRGR